MSEKPEKIIDCPHCGKAIMEDEADLSDKWVECLKVRLKDIISHSNKILALIEKRNREK